jgi:hypothetical protein
MFFSTIASYNFIKYGVEAEKYILVSNNYHKSIQYFSFIALAVVAYHAHFLSLEIWITLGILGIFIGLYALPIFPRTKNLRNLGVMKVLLVAIVWAGTTVVLPAVSVLSEYSWDLGVEVIQRVILIIILLLPFEIRDLAYDKVSLQTLPQRLGVSKTKTLGYILCVIFFLLTFLKDQLSSIELVSKGILFLALGILMYRTNRKQSQYYASFWVEAIPIFWFVLIVFLGRYI